jgi:hypothetical protein
VLVVSRILFIMTDLQFLELVRLVNSQPPKTDYYTGWVVEVPEADPDDLKKSAANALRVKKQLMADAKREQEILGEDFTAHDTSMFDIRCSHADCKVTGLHVRGYPLAPVDFLYDPKTDTVTLKPEPYTVEWLGKGRYQVFHFCPHHGRQFKVPILVEEVESP